MAYFARIDTDGTVVQVVSISDEAAPDPAPQNSESLGQAYIADILGLPGEWKQTSYNNNFRKQYAGIGFRYDATDDVFVAPQPYPSWALDGNHDWQPPTPKPTEGGAWDWDEETLSWTEVFP